MPSAITERTLWFAGRDANGAVRYAAVREWTEAAFARDVLGNIYARVDRVVGYGVRLRSAADIDGVSWAVFPTRRQARNYFDEILAGLAQRLTADR